MSVGDVYSLVLEGDLGAQSIKNVFHYLVTGEVGGPSTSIELRQDFQTDVLPDILDTLATDYHAVRLTTTNIGTPADFDDFTISPSEDGTRPGENVTATACWSFRLNRIFPGQRSGWKRFSGISETDVYGATAQAGVIAALTACAAALATAILGTNAEYSPVVVSRPIVLGITPVNYYIFISAAYAGVGTQVSRKRPFVI